jgi:hypothetical protein
MTFQLHPPAGYRTYYVALACLVAGTGIALFAIQKVVTDLTGLGFMIASILAPVLGGQVWKSNTEAKVSGSPPPHRKS